MANEKINEIDVSAEEDLEMLPDGWGDGDDFFDVENWNGAAAADEQTDEADEGDDHDTETEEEDQDDSTTAEPAADDSTGAELPTTQQSTGKLKFSAKVDHEVRNVELDESELPTIYQKAQATDRAQANIARMQPVYEQVLKTAKILGYATPQEMLQAAEDSYRDGEVERLVSEGTQKDLAEDYVARRIKDAAGREAEAKTEEAAPNGRNFEAEVKTLLEIRPDLKAPGTKLPEEVTRACVESGRPLAVVYLEYEAKQNQAKYDALAKENKRLKQNADAARRAPVRGVSRGGAVESKEDDPFLKGFDLDD